MKQLVSMTFLLTLIVLAAQAQAYADVSVGFGIGGRGHRGGVSLSGYFPAHHYYTGRGYYPYYDYYPYYQVPYNYVVQPAPVIYTVPAVTTPTYIVPDNSSAVTQEEFTVNVPNSKGGYTAVNIKRSGNGFTGPQGEFYNEFPKIQQLRAMYTQ